MNELSFSNQTKIIDESIRTGIHLSKLLDLKGYSYNSLVYQYNNSADYQKSIPFVPVDERKVVANNIPCISFFSGAGGLDIGFECAGFNTLIDVEINRMFCDTLRKNGARNVLGPPFTSGDISDYKTIIGQLEAIGIPKNFPGVFHGGPPCQSFSIAANQRFSKKGENFKRTGFNHKKLGNLLFCYIHVIVHFKPEVFLIENVEGLLTVDNGDQVRKACDILKLAGYNITPPRVINAADYGVPQKRLRTFIVGARIGEFKFPQPQKNIFPSGCVFDRTLNGVENHVTRKHSAESVKRYMLLKFGKRDHLGRVDRLDPNLPSKTIIAGGTGGGGRSHLHPFVPRTMSVRECARLQTFPDSYQFTGPVARQFTQVGNAVPPVLAYAMAEAIYESVYSPSRITKEKKERQNIVLKDSYGNVAECSPVQIMLFETGVLYVDSTLLLTLHGTYRKSCHDWILENNLYNYPITEDEYSENTKLKSVKRLLLTRQKDKPLYFVVKGFSFVNKRDLVSMGYPGNQSHPAKTMYILYKLKRENGPIPSFQNTAPYIVGKGRNISALSNALNVQTS